MLGLILILFSDVPWRICVVSPADDPHCQALIPPSLQEIGRGGVEANTPGLCKSIAYIRIIVNFTIFWL